MYWEGGVAKGGQIHDELCDKKGSRSGGQRAGLGRKLKIAEVQDSQKEGIGTAYIGKESFSGMENRNRMLTGANGSGRRPDVKRAIQYRL